MPRRIAVTGAGGFIGSRLCEILERSGSVEVRRITRRGIPLADADALRIAIMGCDALVHCAFDTYDEVANLAMAEAAGLACATARIRLVHLSTAAVYEPLPDGVLSEASPTDVPGTSYKAVKHAVEEHLSLAVMKHGLDLVILQPTIVYGPRGGAWTDSPIRELLTGQVLLPDAGQGLCNAVHVDDVCTAVIAACTVSLPSGERLLVSGPAPVTWQAFLGAYEAMLGTDSLVLEPPGRATATAMTARPGSLPRSLKDDALTSSATSPGARTLGSKWAGRGGPAFRLGGIKHWVRAVLLGRLGAGGRTRLNFAVQRARLKLRGPKVFRANGAKRALYEARCHVSIEKAEALLGYRPRHDLASGMAATQDYIRQAYGSGRRF